MSKADIYTIEQIAEIIKGKGLFVNKDACITSLVIDSRTLSNAPQALFFSIKAQRDGHQFIGNAYQNGIRNFVVSSDIAQDQYPEANWIKVGDALLALQQLAIHHRAKHHLKVLGITGSNGKTVVKEWLYQLLAADFNIVRSPKSYNSQIGVPLSVWQINNSHNLGIFEAGISTVGEMERLAAIIKPSIGILTNIREAHDEGFANKAEKLKEKLQLFEGVETFIYSPEHIVADIALPGKKKFAWSFNQAADLQIVDVLNQGTNTILKAKYAEEQFEVTIPFTDAASIENAVICWATLLAMGYTAQNAANRLSKLVKVGMRLQLINGIDNCSLIDDSYSADISSLSIALDFLNQQNQHPKRTLILSDLHETGKSADELYQEISLLLNQKKINRLIGIGEQIGAHQHLFKIESSFYKDTEHFLANISEQNFHNETILVKGARKFGFEQVVKRLTQKVHDTVLEVNLNALLANLQFYRSKLSPGVKTMAMVKAFSYGSGSFEIANLLQYHKVDYLAVAYVDEGIALRKAGISLPIMVMSPEPSAFDAMLRYQLEPEIYSLEVLQSFLSFLPRDVVDFPIHIKLDTGMHRLGFEHYHMAELAALLKNTQQLEVVSIFTHLVATDDKQHDEFTQLQVIWYEQMYEVLANYLTYKPIRHVLNTSGISRWAQYHFDMVRLGIGLYGFDAALEAQKDRGRADGLRTVATLKTTITQVKHIYANETVGYGRRGSLPNGGQIATVKIGYADGYSRAFGNGVGKMLVDGKLAPTVGAICMDMCMIDITGLNVEVGDEVIVFNEEHSIVALAKEINTIPYEILTNVSQRVKRVYYYE
ncbi:bifunctional UDP-N-acetylmuramoyl-tripeptide:D-alanyl-D-alanine ligase/alanine racemase [Pedobacter sp. SL55]|uniref:bifunctional UDP-N-acetylmuramoyl-tripeptide:D-alanyl-D-alanine ligase/alanine racemase n=1 Tax=Pedobacter sp. SL55 TaxID=2995161 RepID=UPI00226E7E13|nr:bifunctional UDP-N-acetylmuramoyl-tripeptide:D-alanyl-D-alanine ligase/alanine racemase [Pedobacter sp. SL55]WAC39468.1 bifunctional UDP-N-acetylmuramoyl-tripeptide:D-alanyl-D-alanine ligase/alanine racemase [Pedobacter sp. SL55]